jgi:hypothetical protein
MSETVMNLVNAIRTGDAMETESAFAAAMAEKLSTKIEDMRQSVAQSMFNQVASQPQEMENENV